MKNIKLWTLLALCAAVLLCSCNGNKEQELLEEENEVQQEQQEKTLENKLGFENTALLKAVAQCFDKEAVGLTQEDVLSVRYLAVGPEEDGSDTVYVGLEDYADVYFSADVTIEALQEHVKTAVLEWDEEGFGDLAKFKNVEIFEYYDIPITDVSFIKNYEQLAFGYFQNNGITDVSSLEGYNPETLYKLDFTGNDIADWTPLYDIKDKVIVNYNLQKMQDENGNEVDVPFVTTLEDLLAGDADEAESEITAEDEAENDSESQPKVSESEDEPETQYSDINWGALFGE